MELKVLGPIEVHNPDVRPLGGPVQRRALAMLALHDGRAVSVDQLVDGIWPDGDVPARAEHNVRTYVHRLRTAIGDDDRIETVGSSYRLHLDRDELDVFRFEDLTDEARAAADRGETARAHDLWEQAIDLWRGRPYPEVAEHDWARAEIARLDELRASAVEHLFQVALDAGRHTEVVGELTEAVGEEPYRERRRMQLAVALYRSGRQAEALRAIQAFRAELAEELGLAPSPELDELEHRILDHDPGLLPASHRKHRLRGYELDEVIGEGAFSLVWRGVQPSLGRTVAVKQIRAELANRPEFIRRFENEAQTVAALEHPHIVPLYDYWREPDSAYLVMRYVAGGTLESEVLTHRLDETRLRRMIEQVGTALHVAHRSGVIHRDVKSANVLLDGEDNFYLTDFGIAFTGTGDDEIAASLSTGSPAYASPEQLRRQELDHRTDVYGFGISLFEAATGRLPFVEASTQAALIARQLEDPVPAPSSVDPAVPRWVDEVVARATAKSPGDRYTSMAELMASVPPGASDGAERGHRPAGEPVIGVLVNPFKALRAFREADAADFHGRERLVTRFVEVLTRPGSDGRMLAVVGPSGSGKSSAVRSGLLPQLRAGAIAGSHDWFITTMYPGSRPFEELESALTRVAFRQPGPLVEQMRDDPRGIARAVKQILPDEESELVVVIDQFEELFTHTADGERVRFVDGLLDAVREPRARLRVVMTVRADFWDRPLRHPGLAARLETAAVTVSPLAADELEAAIVEPVRRQGAVYEPGLVARIIADAGDQPGALPLLQYALTELFDRHVSGLIRAEAYDEIGGLTGALASRAEATFEALTDEQQLAARRLFGRLVTLGEGTEDTRRRVRAGELGDDAGTKALVEAFGTARMLVFDVDPTTREPTVEIAHEALLRAWPRLRGWLDEDRDGIRIHRHLTDTAAAWLASDCDSGELYRGGRLETAESWAADHGAEPNEAEREFLAASLAAHDAEVAAVREHREQQARSNRRLRVLVTVATVVAVIAAGIGVLALRERSRAEDNAAEAEVSRTEAERVAFDAETARLAATARDLSTDNPRVASLIALAALQRERSAEAIGALQTVLVNAGPIVSWTGAGTAYTDVELLAGDLVAGIRPDGVDLFEESTGLLLDTVALGTRVESINVGDSLVASSAGSQLAVASDSEVRLFDTADRGLTGVGTFGLPGPLTSVSVTEHTVAATSAGGAVRAWRLTGELVLELDENITSTAAQYPLEESLPLAFPDFWANVPALPRVVHHTAEELGFSIGGELVLVDLEAGTIKNRGFLVSEYGGGGLPSLVAHVVETSDDSYLLVGPGWIGAVESLVGLGETTTLTALPDTIGTGLPNVMTAFSIADQPVAILSDGVIVRYDSATGERLDEVDLGLGDASSAAIADSAGVVTIATSRGLVSVGLDDTGVARASLPRAPGQSSMTVSDSGRFVAAGAGGGLAQGAVFELIDAAWTPVDLDLAVGVANQIETGENAPLNTWVGDEVNNVYFLEGEGIDEPELRFTVSPDVFFGVAAAPPGEFGTLTAFVTGVGLVTYSFETFEPLDQFDLPTLPADVDETGLVYDPPADRLLLSMADGSSFLYDTGTREHSVVDGDIALANWSRSGDLIATVSSTGVVTIRNGDTLEPIRKLLGTAGTSNFWNGNLPLFSPDESMLLTNFDGAPRLWDVEVGVQIGVAFPTSAATNSGISVGERLNVVTASDDSILVWNLDMETWPDLACRLAGSNLTQDEWAQWGPRDAERYSICPQFPTEQ